MAAPPTGIVPISLHSACIFGPPLRRIAPATPPPSCRSLFAAFTIASVSISVRSPCEIWIRCAKNAAPTIGSAPWLVPLFGPARPPSAPARLEPRNAVFIEPHHYAPAGHDHGPPDQVGLFGHETDRFLARGRLLLHVFL